MYIELFEHGGDLLVCVLCVEPLYSGKLSREKTFTNFAVCKSFLPRKFPAIRYLGMELISYHVYRVYIEPFGHGADLFNSYNVCVLCKEPFWTWM